MMLLKVEKRIMEQVAHPGGISQPEAQSRHNVTQRIYP